MIIPMSMDYATHISGWIYENEYSIYSFYQNDDAINELMNGEYYACLDQYNYLLGYFCFGKSAQIPTIRKEFYDPEMLDIGLGMKPILCGKGYGCSFVQNGLDFAQCNFNIKQIKLTVAAFNTRAIRTYEKIGFQHSSNIIHRNTQQVFKVMIYTY